MTNENNPGKVLSKKEQLTSFYTTHKVRLQYFSGLIFIVLVYGLLLNYVSAVLFGLSFTYKTFLAYGICYYILKSELPLLIAGCFPTRPMIPQL